MQKVTLRKRYYGGCEFADDVETIAIERVKKIFDCAYANVQPNFRFTSQSRSFFRLYYNREIQY